jgi:hypothetical protein
MKNPELIKEYPAWPWLLVPFRPSTPAVNQPVDPSGPSAGPAHPVARIATGRPAGNAEIPISAINWELAVRAKP